MLNLIIEELGKAIGNFFLNPLTYWFIFILFIISNRRIKDEKEQFKTPLFPIGAEIRHTANITIISSLLISLLAILFNITFVYEMIIFLSIIIFALTFAFGFKLLSAAYTLSFLFIMFKILEQYQNRLFELNYITNHTFSSIALLIALFLFVEASLYSKITNENAFPEVIHSERGSLFGMYHLQKISIVPFFVFIPGKLTIASLPIIPYFTFNEQPISFAIVPFFIGFHHIIKGQLPEAVTHRLQKYNMYLANLVLITSLISFYLPGIATISISLALLGKTYINHLIEREDREKELAFIELRDDLKIFAIVPHSPADLLGLKVGDTILKVNDIEVQSYTELSERMEQLIRFPSFEIMTENHEVRTITNKKYRGTLTDLGIIFPTSK